MNIRHLTYICIALKDIQAFDTSNRSHGYLCHFQKDIGIYRSLRRVIQHKGPIEIMMWTLAPVHLCKLYSYYTIVLTLSYVLISASQHTEESCE